MTISQNVAAQGLPQGSVYCHKQLVAFSQMYFSQLKKCWISSYVQLSESPVVPACTEHYHHDHLEPFFPSNEKLMVTYKQCGYEATEKCKLLENILDERTLYNYFRQLQLIF